MSRSEHQRPSANASSVPPAVRSFLHQARRGCSLPHPGLGETSKRLRLLRGEAAADPSVGRLVEAHADAMAMFAEAGVIPRPATAFAVWASGRPGSTTLKPSGATFILNGTRVFCGGAAIVDAALVITDSPDGERLVLVDLRQAGIRVDIGTWKSDAFRDAGIATVHFTDVIVEPDDLIGPPGWYGSRPGFWHGSVGVAALWVGIAESILSSLDRLRRHQDETSCIASGTIAASMWAASSLLDQAGQQIDALGEKSAPGEAKAVALSCRHIVRHLLETAIAVFDQEVGPAATAFDAVLGRRRAELTLALAQSHGMRDLIVLAQP